MSLAAFRRVSQVAIASLDDVERFFMDLQANVASFLDKLQRNPRLDPVQVPIAALGGGADTTIFHRLGRQPQGWAITDQTGADSTVRRVSWDAKTLVLHASAGCSVALEVW